MCWTLMTLTRQRTANSWWQNCPKGSRTTEACPSGIISQPPERLSYSTQHPLAVIRNVLVDFPQSIEGQYSQLFLPTKRQDSGTALQILIPGGNFFSPGLWIFILCFLQNQSHNKIDLYHILTPLTYRRDEKSTFFYPPGSMML